MGKVVKEQSAHEALSNWVTKNRHLYDIFLDALCIVDLENRVVDFNTAFMEVCGESYRKVLKIGNFCELIRTEHCPDGCPARQIISSEKPLRLDELKGASSAYPSLQMILGGVPIPDENGRIIGAMITIRDVSAESELQKKYDARKRESLLDGLTQLYNKIYTESLLLRMIKTSMRDAVGLTVIMCDIDHFKKVNDTHGHLAGDYVLATVAQLLQKVSRETDVVGRFGGEEFIALLAKSDVKGAEIFAERFRKRVETTKIVFEGKHIPVTVSLGSASFWEKWKPGFDAERAMKELVDRADNALYYAKANGRNRACQYETIPKKDSPDTPKKRAA